MNKYQLYHILSLCLVGFIVSEALFFWYFLPQIRLARITIKGDLALSDQEIFSLLNWQVRPLYFNMHPEEIAQTLQQATGEQIIVQKKWPNRLVIRSLSQGPLFVSFVEEQRPVYFNEHGHALTLAQTAEVLPVVILQANFNKEKLPEWVLTLAKLKQQHNTLYTNIEGLKQQDTFVLLKFRDTPFWVKLYPDFSIKKLQHVYWQTKQIYQSHFKSSLILDMRGSEIVYNAPGGSYE